MIFKLLQKLEMYYGTFGTILMTMKPLIHQAHVLFRPGRLHRMSRISMVNQWLQGLVDYTCSCPGVTLSSSQIAMWTQDTINFRFDNASFSTLTCSYIPETIAKLIFLL